MSTDPLRALIPCDSAPMPEALQACEWDRTQPLNSIGEAKDINLEFENLYGKIFEEIDGRAADLIRIASFCYVADQYITRGGTKDVHREHWRRQLTLCIRVNDPEFWGSEPVMQALTAALAFATDDDWRFAFSPAISKIGLSPVQYELDPRTRFDHPDSVMLFSGGTDSLCATVDAIAAGKKPLIVSHTPAGHIRARIDELLDELREAHTGIWAFPELPFDIHRAKKSPEGSSQRTRAFLYAALGIGVALQLGVHEVILADNGYVSINPPISGQIVGAIASRGTHPTFLRLMNQLLAHFGDRAPQLTNTLADSTRAEAFKRLRERGLASLLRFTHSCGKSLREMAHPHCGYCSQCIDRRFAFLASGLSEYDGALYEIDLFIDVLPPGEARMVALSYVAFAQEIDALREEQVFTEYQELLERGTDAGVQMYARMLRAARLLKRHAAEVLLGLQMKISEQSEALARGLLPPDCLLHPVLAEAESQVADFGEVAPPEVDSTGSTDLAATFDIEKGRTVVRILWKQPPPEYYGFLIGFERIRLLLLNPGKAISALQLQRLSAGVQGTKDEWGEFKTVEDGFHPDDTGKLDPLVPKEQLIEWRRIRDALEKERAEAIARGNLRAAERCDDQRREIIQLLKKASGLHGRERPDPKDPREMARKTVSQSVREALKQIEAYQPDLALHLVETLHIGLYCSYHPAPPRHWRSAA